MLKGRDLGGPPEELIEALLHELGGRRARRARLRRHGQRALDREQRLARAAQLPLEDLALAPVERRLGRRIRDQLREGAQRRRELLAAAEPREHAHVLGVRRDVRRIEREGARHRRERLFGAADAAEREPRRLDLEGARVRGVRLAGGLARQDLDERLEVLAAFVGAREALHGRPEGGREREHGLVGADGLVVGGGALLVDRRRAVPPGDARLIGEA